MRRLADCCCFSPSFYWHFFSLPPSVFSSWSCSFLTTSVPVDRTRCSRQHTSPLFASCNIHGQPGTAAQHRAAQTRDHLFIYFITLLPGCLMHNNSSTFDIIFSPLCFSVLFFFLIVFSPFIHVYKQTLLHIDGFFRWTPSIYLPLTLLLTSLSLLLLHSFFLSLCFTFIRQMGGKWMECWITDVCLRSLMVVLKYNAIIYNPA